MREPNGFRSDQADTVRHGFFPTTVLPLTFYGREFGAAVDPGDLGRIVHLDHGAILSRQHDNIRQIIFACRIVVADLVKQYEQIGRACGHQTAVA